MAKALPRPSVARLLRPFSDLGPGGHAILSSQEVKRHTEHSQPRRRAIHVRADVNLNPSHQGTGSFQEVHRASDFEADQEESGLANKVGQAVMIVSGAALVAFAAKRRSWSTLGAALAGAPLLYRGATGHWPAPQSLADRASEAMAPKPVEASVTVGKPAAELYSFWRDLENLPRFMKNLESVTNFEDGRSHWIAKSPLGFKVEWDAEIVEEREGQFLSWRSLPGAQVHNAGTV
ncbi:hypothetical protein EHM82_08050, partial [bacterium]